MIDSVDLGQVEEMQDGDIFDWDEVDLDVQEWGPLTPGEYTFEVVDREIKEGPSGYPYVNFRCEVIEPKPGEGQTTSLFQIVSLSPAAKFGVALWLNALEISKPTGVSSADEAAKYISLQSFGKRFKGRVINEDYEGVMQSKIKKVSKV